MGPPCAEYALAWWEICLLDLVALVAIGSVVPLAMIHAELVIAWLLVVPFTVWELCIETAHRGVLSRDGELWFANHFRRWRFHVEDVRGVNDNYRHSLSLLIRAFPCDVRVMTRAAGPILEAVLAADPGIEVRHVAPERPFDALRTPKRRPTEPRPSPVDRYGRSVDGYRPPTP